MERHQAYICLGSNMGEAEHNVATALEHLGMIPGIQVERLSPVYRTEPQNVKEQPWFANQVALLSCPGDMTAPVFLDILLQVEQRMGRKRPSEPSPEVRFGPRIIDLDLLLFDQEQWTGEHLTLPHPRMQERAFVLVPLLDIAPNLTLPNGLVLRESLRSLAYAVEGNLIRQ